MEKKEIEFTKINNKYNTTRLNLIINNNLSVEKKIGLLDALFNEYCLIIKKIIN
jgi:hypothetical protein